MVDRGRPGEGAALWVRYELAPRRAIFYRDLGPADTQRLRRRLPRAVHWVVVANGGGEAPELYSRFDYLQSAAAGGRR